MDPTHGRKLWQLCRNTATGVSNTVMMEHGWEQALEGCTLTLLLSKCLKLHSLAWKCRSASTRLSDPTGRSQ